ncbi:MAG TPA: serine hydrolase [Gemmatimonadaceae bacterium]|nr:serine hydrolase [Gemmatimonadaceae bacterium]
MSALRFIAAATLFIATPLYAQDKTVRVDSIFNFATAQTPGCAAGVSDHGKPIVNKYYGLANLDTRTPLNASSLFDIGSTQKQFTATSMLLLAQDGKVSLSDDIRKYLPELPDYGHKVTIDNLLTHTGGIRDWTGLLPFAPEGTDVATLLQRQRGLNFVPGTEWSYSNGGYELAKTIVARASGMSFADFTRKRIFEPLGMKSTAYVSDILQAGTNASLGYQKDGSGWKPFMRLGNNRGGGAIVSTISDMLTWQDALASAKLGKFVTDKLHEQTRLSNGRQLDYARGVIVEHTPGGVVVSHSGGAAGFSTWMGRVPEYGLSVAVSCNFDPVSATALAGRVADVFLPPVDSQALARARANAPVAASGVDVSSRAGLFFDERTGEPMRLGVNNGRLQVANGPPLVPVSATTFRITRPTTFFRSQDDFVMTFVDDDHIEFKSMEGQVTRFRRAKPYTPSESELQSVDGRYESKELGAVYELVPGKNSLAMRMEGAPEKSIELAPVDRDTYMFRMMIVRFRRDASGKVAGFVYDNPLAKGIAFTRLGNRTNSGGATAKVPVAKDSVTPKPSAASAAAPKLEALVGEYELAPGRSIVITLENGQLQGQPTNNSKAPLFYISGTTFGIGRADSPAKVTFTLDDEGRGAMMTMKQNGQERVLMRVK